MSVLTKIAGNSDEQAPALSARHAYINRWRNTPFPIQPIAYFYQACDESRVTLNRTDGTGFRMIWDEVAAGGDTMMVTFANAPALQAALSNAFVVADNGYRYPKLEDYGDSIEVALHHNSIDDTYVKSAVDEGDLLAASLTLVDRTGLAGLSDFNPSVLLDGRILAAAHVGGDLVIYRKIAGVWTFQTRVYEVDGDVKNPGYALKQADPQVFDTADGQLFVIFQGIATGRQGTPAVNSNSIQAIHPTTFKAIGKPQEFIHMLNAPLIADKPGIFSVSYTKKDGVEAFWAPGRTGVGVVSLMAYAELSSRTEHVEINDSDLVHYKAGVPFDLTGTKYHRTYGTVINTAADGFKADAADSGFWNYTGSVGIWPDFRIRARFQVDNLPVGYDAVICRVAAYDPGSSDIELLLTVAPDGAVVFTYVRTNGTVHTIPCGTAVEGEVMQIVIDRIGTSFWYNGTEYAYGGIIQGLGITSVCNAGNDTDASADQLDGAVYLFNIYEL